MNEIFNKYPHLKDAFEFANFKIKNINKTKICYIFITSNTINPRDAKLDYYIKNKDRFQWENISTNEKILNNAGKIIYIKDPSSKFFKYGINNKINSISKIIDFLERESRGYDVYITGFSAGAYLSLIVSSFLKNVKRLLAFGPIINVCTWKGAYNQYTKEDINYFTNELDYEKRRFFNINDFVDGVPDDNICFGGFYSPDYSQYNELINKEKLHYIWLNTKEHCGDMPKAILINLLSMDDKKIKKLYKVKKPISTERLTKLISFKVYLKIKIKKWIKK